MTCDFCHGVNEFAKNVQGQKKGRIQIFFPFSDPVHNINGKYKQEIYLTRDMNISEATNKLSGSLRVNKYSSRQRTNI